MISTTFTGSSQQQRILHHVYVREDLLGEGGYGVIVGLLSDRAEVDDSPASKDGKIYQAVIMSLDLELMRQCISELETENAKIEAEKAEI
ncbi:hypothetical protein RCL_jg26784.t1 [Rhizophagus clarus]|uniref:Uncharacterized protein n=1 Tax=Rhizophagus clarus TaxID=94130 RepID=A0A8H3LHF8_9GLOM|nr:hypothetical protein RCL_jg26784.t1 [Rhizophagus clarus]